MNEAAIAERLVQFGKDKPDAQAFSESCGVPEADALVNNLKEFPHAFVLACLMDRQGGWKKAWQVPYRMSQRLGEFSIDVLSVACPTCARVLGSKVIVRCCNTQYRLDGWFFSERPTKLDLFRGAFQWRGHVWRSTEIHLAT
jgi:hypothetical protein